MDEVFRIVSSIIYCNVATVASDGRPWNTPVFFGHDEKLRLYWRSWTDNVHSRNIAERPDCFVTIYDSTAAWGTGRGVYLQGHAERIDDEAEIGRAVELMNARSLKMSRAEEFMEAEPRRIYRFTPSHVWMNVEGERNGKFIDVRKEIT